MTLCELCNKSIPNLDEPEDDPVYLHRDCYEIIMRNHKRYLQILANQLGGFYP